MKKKILSIFTAMIMLVSLFTGFTTVANSEDAPIQIGDYIQMGTTEGQPILWRCVAFEKVIGKDGNGNPIMDPTQTVKTYQDGYLPLITNDTPIPILKSHLTEKVGMRRARTAETRKESMEAPAAQITGATVTFAIILIPMSSA